MVTQERFILLIFVQHLIERKKLVKQNVQKCMIFILLRTDKGKNTYLRYYRIIFNILFSSTFSLIIWFLFQSTLQILILEINYVTYNNTSEVCSLKLIIIPFKLFNTSIMAIIFLIVWKLFKSNAVLFWKVKQIV